MTIELLTACQISMRGYVHKVKGNVLVRVVRSDGRPTTTTLQRLAWNEAYGALNDREVLALLCGTARCVNLEHLEPMTRSAHSTRNATHDLVCQNGHTFATVGRYTAPDGRRFCMQCRRDRLSDLRARRAQAAVRFEASKERPR